MDITERKQIEDALRVSEDKYRLLFDLFRQGFCICEMLIDENGHPYDYRFLEVNQLFEQHTGLKDAAGKTALELVPDLERHWIEIYGRVAMTGEPIRFEQGSAVMGNRWFDVYAFRFGAPERHQFAIVFNDISERKLAEQHSELLQFLASALSRAITWQEVTEIIIQKGLDGIGADGGLIVVLSEDRSRLDVIGSLGYSHHIVSKWKSIPLDHPTAPLAFAIREGKQLWLRTMQERLEMMPSSPNLSKEETHQSWAVLPFNINDDLIGGVGLGFNTPQKFDIQRQTFLTTLTEYCAQALHRARLTEQIGPSAAEMERRRLSRDLHDSVKQHLFASSLIAESLPRRWEKSPEHGKKLAADLVNMNRAALAELQSLLLEMRPEAIVTSPFMTLVKNLCDGLRGHKPITINLTYQGPDELLLPADIHVALYRMTQETFNNVNKHSGATQLDIDVRYTNDMFRMRIGDNGHGFDPQHTASGFGMSTMRERAQAIGAEFEIQSAVGSGTEVSIEWSGTDAR